MKYTMQCVVEDVGDIKYVGQKQYPKRTIYAAEVGEERDAIRSFEAFGENAVSAIRDLQDGDTIEVVFRVKGREWQGRVFCDLSYVSHTVVSRSANPAKPPVQDAAGKEPEEMVDMTSAGAQEDIPF